MATETSTPVTREGRTDTASAGGISPGERQRMLREAAYYRFVQRGFAHGHDLDDWLAAEAELDSARPKRQAPEPVEVPEFEVQQSGMHGFRQDEALKRMVRQHPQRDIPRVEGIEPQEAPLKE